jgi:hypothetical protein
MKIISHRGNLTGSDQKLENKPEQIEKVINMGFDVEVDLRVEDNQLYLGHDFTQYNIEYEWIDNLKNNLWIHAKNYESVNFLKKTNLNWFWHDQDDMTLTSHGFIWSNIDKYFTEGITVSLYHKELPDYILGVCTDEPLEYQKQIFKIKKNEKF